ncbi:hypothetical protein BDD12DRAFT_810910 [Trichophaea hybrida]|nr:hypothetical protein BDD12DRAFT_810910 [Trichophaea hybrida]
MDSQPARKPAGRPGFFTKKARAKAGRPGFVESPAAGPQPIKAGPARPVSNTGRSWCFIGYTIFELEHAASMGAVYGTVMYGKLMVAMFMNEITEKSNVLRWINGDEA